ncbi:MAG: TetR family transcriptional regulator [Sphingopyxis sp.]|nr:MAG: TetR family transcriptional regulator [Sphingopyxis sp.]
MPRVKLFDEKEVLNKAMNLFWKKGYSATSVQDLVSHLGINRASLYDTFGDKEKLFKKAFEHYRKINIEGLTQFFQGHPDVKDGFSKLFEIAIDEAVKDKDKKGCFVVNTTTELIPGDDSISKLVEENKRNFESLFYDYLKKGKDIGQLKSKQDLKSFASLLYTLYSGIRVVSKVNPNKKKLTDSINIALSLLG